MLKLDAAGQPLDFVTLSDSIRTAGELDQIGGRSWISSLIDGALRLPNIEAYARTIQQAARNRDTITTFHDASRMIQEGKDPEIVINLATDALDMIRRGGPNRKAAANLWDGVTGERPAPILTAAGKGGSVLTVGNVCLLSGEGGIAKSALALGLAVGLAQLGDHERGQVCGLFDGMGGPTLLATFEDHPTETHWRAHRLAANIDNLKDDDISRQRTLRRVHVLDLAGRPRFRPQGRRRPLQRTARPPGRLVGFVERGPTHQAPPDCD